VRSRVSQTDCGYCRMRRLRLAKAPPTRLLSSRLGGGEVACENATKARGSKGVGKLNSSSSRTRPRRSTAHLIDSTAASACCKARSRSHSCGWTGPRRAPPPKRPPADPNSPRRRRPGVSPNAPRGRQANSASLWRAMFQLGPASGQHKLSPPASPLRALRTLSPTQWSCIQT